MNRILLSLLLVTGITFAFASARPAAAAGVTLLWTATGDDSLSGVATAFDMRFSTGPITATNFLTGTPVAGMPAPAGSGTTQQVTVQGLNSNTTYYFAMKTVDERGNWSALSNVVVRTSQLVDVEDELAALDFSVPYPNPARGNTRFSFSLPEAGDVRVEAYDIAGRLVKTLMNSRQRAGHTDLNWNLTDNSGGSLGAGIYFVRATLGQKTFMRRVTVLK
jgi:hypothetical protein